MQKKWNINIYKEFYAIYWHTYPAAYSYKFNINTSCFYVTQKYSNDMIFLEFQNFLQKKYVMFVASSVTHKSTDN